MGVISVGASLGVRTSRTNVPAPVSVSTSSTSIRRSSTSSTSTPVSSTALNSRKKSSRKRLTSVATKKRSISANHDANSVRNDRSIPLATGTVTSTNTPASVTPRTVAPSVSMAINCKKPIGRLVYVRTTMEPDRLAPHVIGANGDKLNAIMSRARCNISYRNTQSLEDKDKTLEDKNKTDEKQMDFAMAFMISANTMKRVDDGVLLLQAVVESTEQQLRKYQGRGKREEQKQEKEEEEKDRHVVNGERKGALQEEEECHAQRQIRQERSFETGTSRNRSRSCGAIVEETMTLQRQRRPKRRRNGDSATSGVTKRGRSAEHRDQQVARSDRHLTGNENEEGKEDIEAVAFAKRAEDERRLRDEGEAFRIRMARTLMISRRLEAEAKRARAQEVLERDKYLRLRRQCEEMEHRKKVAELVVTKQCKAMAASLSTSSSSKKKQHLLGMERLNDAQDACPLATSQLHVSDLRARGGKTNRVHAGKSRLRGLSYIGGELAEDGDLVCLARKVQAFGKMITSGSIELSTTEDSGVQLDADHGEVVNAFDFPTEDADECMDMDVSNADEAVADMAMETFAEDSEARGEEKSSSRRDSFRSTWDLPGLTRDLNLIQDYSLETDCKLLRFLAGERQYFYLESLVIDSSYSREVERWLLTAHDVHILRRYLLERADIGKEIVLCAERLRALGNLVPPLSFLSGDNSLNSELGVFESSRHKEWSELQDKIVTLHSLALVAHMLGRHYLARQMAGRSNQNTNVTGTSHDNLVDEDTLKSDLFTYILRPIRSSAIESSLFDSLPISLVRETIEQCPEVVNHVLQWKGKDDVPEYLHEVNPCDAPVGDGASTAIGQQVYPSSSYFLRNLLLRLTAYMRDLDAIIKVLVSTLKEKRRGRRKGNGNSTSRRRQRLIAHVNRLKSVTAHVVVENTKLQLHKWWILFAENSCAWFDPDSVDEMDDRSYDKFTCLQDALYIWHNEALLYTTRDDFVDPERLKESAHNQTEDSTADGAYNAAAVSYPYAAMSRDTGRTPIPRDEEVAALIRLTPVSLRDEVQNRPFTVEEAEQCIMTPRDVENARAQLEESLASTRDLMNELGRSGPWRTHVQHSNSLKCELAKQLAIRGKLVKHQWARYYTKYQEFAPPQPQDASSDQEDEEKAPSENADSQPQGEPTAESGSDAASMAIDWTGVFDPEKDAPDIIEMKKLRHEITLAKDQLLRDISRDGKNGCGVTLQSSVLNGDQKALVEECKGLAASCTQALGKFLGMEETCETAMPPIQKKHTRSTTKPTRPGKRPTTAAKGDRATRTSTRRQTHESKKVSARALRSGLGSRSRRSESIRVAKALAASNADFLLPLARSSGSRTSSSRAMSVRSIGSSCDQRSEGSPPLRMGCSGCRDLRRRCTGCSGCCLHCVCVSCGCRMCCSSRLSAVQKTMTQMLDVIEVNETCKWMSSASAGSEGHHCGMLFFCQQCHSCEDHCPCLLTGSASEPAVGLTSAAPPTDDATLNSTDSSSGIIASPNATSRGTSSSVFSRRQRRFRINPVAAQRRGPNVAMDDTADNDESASAHRDSNDPSGNRGSAPTHGGRGPLPTFDYGIDDAFGLGPMAQPGQCRTWRPAPSDKNEQEDLFRAARVRMKLVRSAYAKTMGLSSGSGCLDGEQLWQPERIRMMWERRDFHGVLGLQRDASVQQIKRQYRKLALKLHPDKASDASASLESTVAEADRNVGAGNSGERVDAFVAATHSYKILLGDVDAVHARAG